MSIWILTVWLVLPNGMLETVRVEHYPTEEACLAESAKVEMPKGVSWIASCRAGLRDSKL